MYRKYKIILILFIVFLVGLIFQNYKMGQEISKNVKKQTLIKEDEKSKFTDMKNYGYTDIIEILGKKDNIKIKKFDEVKEKNIALVEIEMLGDIYSVEKELKYIKEKENFINFNNIKIEKNDSSVISRVNISFINNR